MSPNFDKRQSIERVRTKAPFFQFWHSALKWGVVVAPIYPPQIIKSDPTNPKNFPTTKVIRKFFSKKRYQDKLLLY